MIQVNEGVSLEDLFGFEHYADTFRNFIFDICDMWNPCYFIVHNHSKGFNFINFSQYRTTNNYIRGMIH